MNEHNDDLTINGRPAPGDEVIGPQTTPAGGSTGSTTPPPPPPTEGTSMGGPTTPADAIETAPRLPRARPIEQSLPPSQAKIPADTPTASELIHEDITDTSTSGTGAGAPPTGTKEKTPQGLPDQLRERAMDRAMEMTSQMGTTAGQLFGQAMELGSVAEQGARHLGELVQHQASEIVRQAQERFGMLEPQPSGMDSTTGGTPPPSPSVQRALQRGSNRVATNARQLGRRVGEQLPTEVNPIALVALGLSLGLAIGGAIYLLTRRREAIGAAATTPSTGPSTGVPAPLNADQARGPWDGAYDNWEIVEIG